MSWKAEIAESLTPSQKKQRASIPETGALHDEAWGARLPRRDVCFLASRWHFFYFFCSSLKIRTRNPIWNLAKASVAELSHSSDSCWAVWPSSRGISFCISQKTHTESCGEKPIGPKLSGIFLVGVSLGFCVQLFSPFMSQKPILTPPPPPIPPPQWLWRFLSRRSQNSLL